MFQTTNQIYIYIYVYSIFNSASPALGCSGVVALPGRLVPLGDVEQMVISQKTMGKPYENGGF